MKRFIILTLAYISLFGLTQIYGLGSYPLLAKPVEKINSKEEVKTIEVKVTGMTCAGCASSLHKALSKQAGILENEVKYPGDVAVIKYDAAKISEAQILALIEKNGYKAQLLTQTKKATDTSSLNNTKGCCVKKSI